MILSEYDAKDTVVTLVTSKGTIYLTQMGESMVTFSKDEAFFETSVGAQGDVVKSKINNPLYAMAVSLQNTSPQRHVLNELMNSGEIFGIWAENKKLQERFGGTKASVEEMPEITRGATAEDVEYSIRVFDGVVEKI